MTPVVLVRHAEPLVADGIPSAQWPLTDGGRNDARRLGALLANGPVSTCVWTSPERKAQDTAALAFPSVTADVREQLSEVRRPWYPGPAEMAEAVAGYLGGASVEGWEPREYVVARLEPLRTDITSHDRLVVVSHGVLLTTWIHHEIGLEDPVSFWANLRLPDAWELDLEEKTLKQIA